MTKAAISDAEARKQAMAEWLAKDFDFTHFVTLATSSSMLSMSKMHSLLKKWDARMNRQLYGAKWRNHHDELLFWFAFIEKPEVNPHWHLLVRFQDADKCIRFCHEAEVIWLKLLPAGTVKIEPITRTRDRLGDYVAKQLGSSLQYTNFITPDEYRRV